MKTTLKILVNIAYAGVAILAAVDHHPGALNLIYFLSWFHIVLGTLVFIAISTDEGAQKLHTPSQYRRLIPRQVDAAYDAGLMCLFAWSGLWVPAIASLVALFATQRLYAIDDKRAKEGDAPEAAA